jgi:hypothetical protein
LYSNYFNGVLVAERSKIIMLRVTPEVYNELAKRAKAFNSSMSKQARLILDGALLNGRLTNIRRGRPSKSPSEVKKDG